MGLEEIMLSEISQAERVNHHMVSTYLWRIRNNMENIGRRRGEVSWGKLEGETNLERLWTLRNKMRVLEGRGVEGWVSLVVGIKEGMDCMEHRVWCINNESWNIEKIK